MKINLFGVIIGLFLLSALSCATKAHWAGVYAGVIPTADGEGINVRVTLNANDTYRIEYEDYTGSGDYPAFYGKFTWNLTRDTLTMGRDPNDAPLYYKLGDKALIHLVIEGDIISGELGSDYLLYKQK